MFGKKKVIFSLLKNQKVFQQLKNVKNIVTKYTAIFRCNTAEVFCSFRHIWIPPNIFIDGQELGRSKVPSDLNKVSRASKNMWKILVLAPVLFILSNSEVVSKRKTIPLSKQTCPCWWDLEGTQIDPNTNEPYKCACCKSGKKFVIS